MFLAASLIFSLTVGYPAVQITADMPQGGVVVVAHRADATPPVIVTDSAGRVYQPAHVWEPVEVQGRHHGAVAFEIDATEAVFLTIPGITTHPTGAQVAIFGPMPGIEYLHVVTGNGAHIHADTPAQSYLALLSAYGGHVHIHGPRGGHGTRQLSTGAYTRFSSAAQAGRGAAEFSVVKRHADETSVYTYGRTERNAPEFVPVDWALFMATGR